MLIDRTTQWGNPYRIGRDGTRSQVIQKYREWIVSQPRLMQQLPSLKGKILGCHCLPKACHGQVLIELVDGKRMNLFEDA